ncbi:MAG: hypothetical protein GKC04_01855 [Methanomicrobiales archaeon]|nr:hypothetical protein [Methanomicrobiales archaeon]
MPRERIIAGDLDAGTGVEGRKKAGTGVREQEGEPDAGDRKKEEKKKQPSGKKDFRKPAFKDHSDADIFDTSKP